MIPGLRQPRLLIALAGPNGAGKSTFFELYLRAVGLRFINADVLALSQALDPYEAAAKAGKLREEMISQGESFVFETVLSDPEGEKVDFLRRSAREQGYRVVLCFIGLDAPETSDERVALRVAKGGHDVPTAKLRARYPRTMANLGRALAVLPEVYVYDNSDYERPYRFVAEYREGKPTRTGVDPSPAWFLAVEEKIAVS